MKYHEINAASRKSNTRKGRGIAAGKGKTAGRGTKGQNARTGGGTRPGFEGGQSPLYMRLPKLPGFKSKRKPVYEVKTSQINALGATKNVTNAALKTAGLVPDEFAATKLIADEELKKAYNVNLQAASKKAVEYVEKAGGKFEKVEVPKRTKSTKQS